MGQVRHEHLPHNCYDSDLVPRFFLFFAAMLLHAETLDDAVRALASSIASQLAPGEVAHLSERSLAPSFAAETSRAKDLLDRALRQPANRVGTAVEVLVTATENARGPVLVIQLQKGQDTSVEIAAYTAAPAARTSDPVLASRLLWEQDQPILDLALIDDEMLVLGASEVTRYRRTSAGWDRTESRPVPLPGRDPRGRMILSGESIALYLPGGSCKGQWKSSLQWNCEETQAEFSMEGENIHFSAGRNTLENSTDKFYSLAHAGNVRLAAAQDGRIHASQGPQTFAWDGWGSDLVAMAGACGAGPVVVATSANNGSVADSLTALEVAGQTPRAAGSPLPTPGPVTALWPASGGALAVARQLATGKYAAYNLTLDCSR